jgi:pimeloyl-ACP methyl ester carboxylesterase
LTASSEGSIRGNNLISATLVILALAIAGCGDDDGGSSESVPLACDSEPVVMTTDDGIDFVRTPDSCFDSLPGWPYAAEYVEIDGLRQAYVDEGPEDGPIVLLLHGQPSWAYLYRKMIPILADGGYRVIAMDHLGMGRSDKPIEVASYSFLGHYDRLERFIEALELRDINMFVQDWGSLLGLRLAGLNPDLFARIAVGDGTLPVIPEGVRPFPSVEDPDEIRDIPSIFANVPAQQPPFYDGCEPLLPSTRDFGAWIVYSMTAASFRPSEVVEAATWFDLPADEEAAYDAPFPSRIYMGGPRTFPSLVNELGGLNEEAWEGLMSFERPFLTIWASNDPGNLGRCSTQEALIDAVPGAVGQPHDRLPESSHFLQDDQGEEIARRLVEFYASENAALVCDEIDDAPRPLGVGHEILQVVGPGNIIVWLSLQITQAEFDAIELPSDWFKNNPLEGQPDGGRFFRSPDATTDGPLTTQEHFGFVWFHPATVVESPILLDDAGLLVGARVAKFHEVRYNACRAVEVLTSPEGESYVLVSRDTGRPSETSTLPEGWKQRTYVPTEELVIQLPNPTLVIRTNIQDSFQGPVSELADLF